MIFLVPKFGLHRKLCKKIGIELWWSPYRLWGIVSKDRWMSLGVQKESWPESVTIWQNHTVEIAVARNRALCPASELPEILGAIALHAYTIQKWYKWSNAPWDTARYHLSEGKSDGRGACIEVVDSAIVNREAEVKPEASLPLGELSPSDMAYGLDNALSALCIAKAAGGVLRAQIFFPPLFLECLSTKRSRNMFWRTDYAPPCGELSQWEESILGAWVPSASHKSFVDERWGDEHGRGGGMHSNRATSLAASLSSKKVFRALLLAMRGSLTSFQSHCWSSFLRLSISSGRLLILKIERLDGTSLPCKLSWPNSSTTWHSHEWLTKYCRNMYSKDKNWPVQTRCENSNRWCVWADSLIHFGHIVPHDECRTFEGYQSFYLQIAAHIHNAPSTSSHKDPSGFEVLTEITT